MIGDAVSPHEDKHRYDFAFDNEKYWYNMSTGEVEFGMASPGSERIGPFDTEAEAARAPEVLRERSRAWADEDDWDGGREETGSEE